jgi:hypothetical protein
MNASISLQEPLLPATSGLFEFVVPLNGSEYTSIENITFALHDWAVKGKFSFRRAKSSGRFGGLRDQGTDRLPMGVRGEVQSAGGSKGKGKGRAAMKKRAYIQW